MLYHAHFSEHLLYYPSPYHRLLHSFPTRRSSDLQTALASIKLIQASAVLDLTEDDFDFLTSNKVWIATDRSRARRCNPNFVTDRKSGSAGMPRPISYAVFCLKKKK